MSETKKDDRVPDGAAWEISDDTGNCWEITFYDRWHRDHIRKADYDILRFLWDFTSATGRVNIESALRNWRYGESSIVGLFDAVKTKLASDDQI